MAYRGQSLVMRVPTVDGEVAIRVETGREALTSRQIARAIQYLQMVLQDVGGAANDKEAVMEGVMTTLQLEAGEVVHVCGWPMRLAASTVFETSEGNAELIAADVLKRKAGEQQSGAGSSGE